MDPVSVGSALGNLLTSCALAAAGIAAFSMAIVPARTPRALPPLLAFVAGAALVFLAADEGLELHDRVGRWLYHERGIEAPGPVNHVDDLIVFAYVACAVAVALISLPPLIAAPRFLASMGAAGTLMIAGASFDAFGTPGSWTEIPEEGLEAAGACALAAVLAFEALRGRTLRFHRRAAAPAAEPHPGL
jgi:hypothetical protein